MPTVTVSLDDGTQVYSIGFGDSDWTNLLQPTVNQHNNTILVSPAVLDQDGNVVTPAVYRSILPNEALALVIDTLFQSMIRDALVVQQQSLTPIAATALDTLNPIQTPITVSTPVVIGPLPPVQSPPVKL